MNILENTSLRPYNTFHIDVLARYLVTVTSEDELIEVLGDERFNGLEVLVLGGGSNVVLSKNWDGLVILNKVSGISEISKDEENVILEVGGGENWHELVRYTVDRGYGGIENMALIPGTVGGAAVQNIAAYGQNLSDVFDSLIAVDTRTLESKNFKYDDCGFTYRESIFKRSPGYIVTKVRIKLATDPKLNTDYWSNKHGSITDELGKIAVPPYTVKDVFNAIVSMRTAKFPDLEKLGTAGSFFKNPVVTLDKLAEIQKIVPNIQYYPVEKLQYPPNVDPKEFGDNHVKIAAGQLLDDGLGLKGKWVGHCGLFEKHALIVVSDGEASADELISFVKDIQAKVQDKFGIQLEAEVNVI